MSQENLSVVRDMLDAFNRDDLAAVIASMRRAVRLSSPPRRRTVACWASDDFHHLLDLLAGTNEEDLIGHWPVACCRARPYEGPSEAGNDALETRACVTITAARLRPK